MTATDTTGTLAPVPANTGSLSNGQKVGVAAGIAVLVALAAEGSRRLYNKRVKARADAAAVDAAAAAHLKEVEDLRAETAKLREQLNAVLSAKIEGVKA